MAWIKSRKIVAILSQSDEGKDIIEKAPDLTEEELEKELDAFFGEGGKGAQSSNDYNQEKFDIEAEEEMYKSYQEPEDNEKEEKVKLSSQETRNKLTGGYTRLNNIQSKFDLNSSVETAKDTYKKMGDLKKEFEEMEIADRQDFDKEDKEKLVKQIDYSMSRLSRDWPEVLEEDK